MELTALYQRVIGVSMDVHQAKITACAIVEHNDGEIEIIEREFGAFKRDRRALAEWERGSWHLSVWSWRVRARTGRAPMRRWRRWGSMPWW